MPTTPQEDSPHPRWQAVRPGDPHLFHQAGTSDNGSMGCQTIASSDYNRFIQAVGGRGAAYNYSLGDANTGP
ncbi:MAG TPA: hypothetical protein VLQ93_15195 [Myxococcaceae bacterium]|nr:hypothetical protein [Myxococcaceae bacterium]